MRKILAISFWALMVIGCAPVEEERVKPKVELEPFEKAIFEKKDNIAKPKVVQKNELEAANILDDAFAGVP